MEKHRLEQRMASVASSRPATSGWTAWLQDLILPVGIITSLLVILMPVPAHALDLLLAANITIAVIMLLTTIYVRTPLEFNIFPSLLLATTLFRLVLNVATTRLILTRAGTDGDMAAGQVVRTFGQFVTGGTTGTDNVVVGLIIFSIIVIIQFVVITKGATRVSEVAARFTLDGMPGRQMAIDADVSAGIIDDREAQRRRLEVVQQADFFGAMDGASKFVRGDAIAGIIIIFINIIAGLFIGMVEAGMSLGQAASLFTTLTIGDGLVTQVPAFLISLAAGLLVTRSSQPSNLPRQFVSQLFSRPQALAVAGGFLGILVFTSLPSIPLLLIGAACVGMAVTLTRRENKARAAKVDAAANQRPQPRVEDYLAVDPMEVELGVGLIRLADAKRGGDLLERIGGVRQTLAGEIGIILPKVRIRDNMRLDHHQYRIKIADTAVAEGSVAPEAMGEAAGQITSHLAETVRQNADELLTRDAAKHLIDELRRTSPVVVDELIPNVMKLSEVQLVLQTLLREQIPIRQLGVILESLGDFVSRTKDPVLLAEYVRQRLARTICARYRDKKNRLHVVTLDPTLEDEIRNGCDYDEQGLSVRLPPQIVEDACRSIEAETQKLIAAGRPPVVLVSPLIRMTLRQLTVSQLPQLVILGSNEITRDTKIESVAMIRHLQTLAPAA
jgi:flagellar biosynthesis protein FlhA